MTNEQLPQVDAELLDLKSVVEATFGEGAFDLIAESDEPAQPADAPDAAGAAEPADASDEKADAEKTRAKSAAREIGHARPAGQPAKALHPKLVLFELAGQEFGLSVSHVVEVRREPPVTRIPHVPSWIRGVTNLRGSIVSVVDLRLRFGFASLKGGNRRRMIVVRAANEVTTGLLVDRILGIRVLPDRAADSPDPSHDRATRFVSGWREMDAQPVAILDLEKAIAI